MSGHVQVYIDGDLIHEYHGVLSADWREVGHPADNGETVPLKAVIELRLSHCPLGHDDDEEFCI